MWLLDTQSYQLKEFSSAQIPEYAILSHMWEADEVLFQDIQNLSASTRSSPAFAKLQQFCASAQTLGYEYAWMDTCCIDKRSSAELTEAINSMYTYYRRACVCIIYLSDISNPHGPNPSTREALRDHLQRSGWWKRGWTLQELIACNNRLFYAQDWSCISLDSVPQGSETICSSITQIPAPVLNHTKRLEDVCIAERMSWAAHRKTTRPEDRAYSLMGIFGVNMAPLYGEGLRGAFRRLQDEIMKRSFDQTLFAWRGPYKRSGLLARTPDDFAGTPVLGLWAPVMLAPYAMTNVGLHLRPCFWTSSPPDHYRIGLQCDIKDEDGWKVLCVRLERLDDAFCVVNNEKIEAYQRVQCDRWDAVPSDAMDGLFKDAIIVEGDHHHLIKRSSDQDRARTVEDNFGTKLTTMKAGMPSKPWRVQGVISESDGELYYEE